MFKNILFVVLALLDVALVGMSFIMAMMSVMLFDAGETATRWLIFYSVWAIPLIGIIALIAGPIWLIGFKKQDTALLIIAAPLVYGVVFAVMFMVLAALEAM